MHYNAAVEGLRLRCERHRHEFIMITTSRCGASRMLSSVDDVSLRA